MQKEIIKCSMCEYCEETRRYGNSRSEFSCKHPAQSYILNYFREHKMNKMPGFLNYGKPWSHDVPLKTSPAWCPQKRVQD